MRTRLPGLRQVDVRSFLLVSLIVSYALHALWGFAFARDIGERAERRDAINALACALQNDALGSTSVLATRHLPGDEDLLRSKTALYLAAFDVNPNCPTKENP